MSNLGRKLACRKKNQNGPYLEPLVLFPYENCIKIRSMSFINWGGKSIITIFFHLRNKKKIWYYKTFKNFSPPNFISDFSCVLYLFLKFITSCHISFLLQFFFKNNYFKKKIFSWILLLFTVRNENCSIWHQHIATCVFSQLIVTVCIIW